jgi:peptidoglycan/xylan/chitin deacetylase (PgdA/CDA1 family)
MIGGNLGAAVQMIKVINQQGGGSQSWESYWASHTPDDLSVVWENDYAKLTWTANGDKGAYEIWESINDGAYALVATTAEAATTYNNYTSQNASMKFKIRGVGGGVHSEYTSEVVLVTPLVWKTDQSTITTVTIAELYVDATFKAYLNWGDGSALQEVTGNATNITHDYTAAGTGQYFIAMSGNLDKITRFVMYNQSHLYGDLSKWIITRFGARFRLYNCNFSGDISNWTVGVASTQLYGNNFTGKIPESTDLAGVAAYDINGCYMTGTNLTKFRTGAGSVYNFKDQKAAFPTDEIDKFLLAMADYYETHTPLGNLTVSLTGNYMGVPTGGNSNVDKVRTEGYYTAAGFTATINVNAPVPFATPLLMITFDGNIESLYSINLPVLVAKSAKATYYTYSDGVGAAGNYTWANCLTMATAGMDIQDHSKDHLRMTEKTEAQLIADFEAVNAAFVANGLASPNHLAYPFGSSNALVESVAADYRQTGRKYTPDTWLIWKNLIKMAVPCYTIDGVDIETIKAVLDSAIAGNALVVTLNHYANAAQLGAMIDYAIAGGMTIVTVSEMYALL